MNRPIPNQNIPTDIQDDEVDIVAIFIALIRGWKTILTLMLIGLLIGATYSRFIQPVYETDALIQVDDPKTSIESRLPEFVTGLSSSSAASTELQIITSRLVLNPVVEKLHLDIKLSDPNITRWDRFSRVSLPVPTSSEEGVFLDTRSGLVTITSFEVPKAYINQPFTLVRVDKGFELSLTSDVTGPFTFIGKLNTPNTFKTPEGDISITVQSLPSAAYPVTLRKLTKFSAVSEIVDNLTATEAGSQSGIIKLAMQGSDPKQISDVLNEVIDSYINQNVSNSFQRSTATLNFIESQLPELKSNLEKSESAFNSFREQYGTINIDQESSILINERAQLESQINSLNLKKTELLTYYTEEHPLVLQVEDQLSDLELRKQEIKETVSTLPEIQREFLQLSEDMKIDREIYLSMLKNHQQLSIARAGETSSVRVLDKPIDVSRTLSSTKLLYWILPTLLGAMLGILWILAKDLLQNKVLRASALERKTGLPVIATISHSKAMAKLNKKDQNNLLSVIDSQGASYAGIKDLLTAIVHTMPNTTKEALVDSNTTNRAKTVVITSEAPNVGKSFITSNLAAAFSELSYKVLIINTDNYWSNLDSLFPIDNTSGIYEYLTHKGSNVSEFIHPTSFEYIDLMPVGQTSKSVTSLLATVKFEDMLNTLSGYYDYIIINTPPILATTDAITASSYADKVILVARYNKSTERQVVASLHKMQALDVMVDGIVLNDVKQSITQKYSPQYKYTYKAKH